jgi:cobalamin biosynthesis protein CobW
VDGALARASAGDVEVVDFPAGLIAYAEDTLFVPTLRSIAGKRVDHVLIETSGVALPSAAMARLQSPELRNDFVLDATLVVVDTPRLLAGEFESGEPTGALFDLQLAAADVAVLNKIDELDADALLKAEELVRRRAPNVRFLELAYGAQLDFRLALGLGLHQSVPRFTPVASHGRVDGHTHSGLLAHNHGLSTHTHFHEQDPGWLSFTLRSDEQQEVEALRIALERIAGEEPLLRCKGFVLSTAEGRPALLQGVRTRVVASEESPGVQSRKSELVFIGYHLSRARVAASLSRRTGRTWS